MAWPNHTYGANTIKPLLQQPTALLILGLLLAAIAHGLLEIFALAQAHWAEPNLHWDSFTFVQRSALPGWLAEQHNEHRIVWAKVTSIIETDLLKLPPGQSALFQNLALILGSSGLWIWICRRMLHRTDLCLITALAGSLLLINPWQWENLSWEFQTPWFLINALVLLGALLLTTPTAGRWPQGLAAAGLPWFALSSTGQGLALTLAFTACAWLHSRRLGTLVTASTALAGLTFFVLLPYRKPAAHPELSFQLDYFMRAWLGGPWQGLAVLAVVIAAVLLGRRQPIAKSHWPALLMPGLFSVIFAGMITLSRAGFGVEQANASRYITHTLMLGLTALLALAISDDRSQRPTTPLLGGGLVLLSTLGSFPQSLQPGGLSYTGAWTQAKRSAEQNRHRFVCHADQAALVAQNIRLLKPCQEIYPHQRVVDRYFRNASPIQPMGWHLQLLTAQRPTPSGSIRFHLDQQNLSPTAVQLQGWAFQNSQKSQQLYLIADYGGSELLAVPVDQPREDVKRSVGSSSAQVGFNATFPRRQNGQPLRVVRVGTPNRAVQLWKDPSADD